MRLESRFERWRPEVDRGKWREGGTPEDAGGVLFDLGPHVIDQALELLGPARSVYAEVRTLRPGAEVDDDFFLALEHESGARSHLWGTMLAAQAGPRFRALGTSAAYVKWGLDVQEAALRAGADPRDPGFGEEPQEAWGTLGADDDRRGRSRPSRAATWSSTRAWSARSARELRSTGAARGRHRDARGDRGRPPKRGGAHRHRSVTRPSPTAPTGAPPGRTFARMREASAGRRPSNGSGSCCSSRWRWRR